MSAPDANGKSTASLVLQVALFIAAIATPAIVMYAKVNALEVEFASKMQEVETQFKAADEFRNVNLAGQMRWNSLLWRKCYDEPFPAEVYFPAIAKPR